MIVNFQTRLSNELQSQTQEVVLSDAEVDEHAITKRVFDEQHGHVKGVGPKVKGVGNSTSSTAASHASFAPGSSFVNHIHAELATVRAESQQYRHES